MALLPVSLINTFASQTGPIPLSQLDSNFSQLATAVNYNYYIAKAGDTSRSSTTTLANDPELIVPITAAGTYKVEAFLDFSFQTNGGFAYNLNFSGSYTANRSIIYPGGGVNGGALSIGNLSQIQSTTTTASYSNNVTTPNQSWSGYSHLTGSLVALGAGTLGVSWAQFASNATASTLYQGSYLIVTRIL